MFMRRGFFGRLIASVAALFVAKKAPVYQIHWPEQDLIVTTAGFIWRDRLVRLRGDCFEMSRKGDFRDFSFIGTDDFDVRAVAGNAGGGVRDIEKIDEDRLRLICNDGDYILTGDRFGTDAFISRA